MKMKFLLISLIAFGGLGWAILSTSCNDITVTQAYETDSFKDPRDGKVYKTVKIGDQWLMSENLAFRPDSGKFWAYDNDSGNVLKYGYLYDWETA